MYEKIKLVEILIEITTKCNLNCVHCFNRPSDNGNTMTLKDINTVIKKCLKHGAKKFVFSGGEPLLHPEIKEIIKNCAKYPDIQFLVTTNGLLLNEELLSLMSTFPNIEAQISLDGTKKEIYEAQRGLGTYEKFMTGFNLLAKSKIKIRFARICVTKLNYRDVENIYKMSINNNISPSFIFLSVQGNAVENWDDINLSYAQKVHVIDTINRLNEKYNLDVPTPTLTSKCDFAEDQERKHLLIRPNGDVSPCQYYYVETIGNILKNDFDKILSYENPNLKELYITGKKRKETLAETTKCKECKVRYKCGIGCLGKAKECGNSMGFDGECDLKVILEACYLNEIIKNEYKSEQKQKSEK